MNVLASSSARPEKITNEPFQCSQDEINRSRSIAGFCRSSFFRSSQSKQLQTDLFTPFYFPDGRIYKVDDLFTLNGWPGTRVLKRCCFYVTEKLSSDFMEVEVCFCEFIFEDSALDADDDLALIIRARQHVWQFLCGHRHIVPRSRYGHSYYLEVKS